MKFNIFFLVTIQLAIGLFSNAQTQFWSDNFENVGAPSAGTRIPTTFFTCNIPATAYFSGVEPSSISLQSANYNNFEGSKIWAGEDIDFGPACSNGSIAARQSITWTGINISGKTNLSFRGLFAANNFSAWEGVNYGPEQDFMDVEYRIDGGAWIKIIGFYPSDATFSSALSRDTDGDLIGDGPTLTYLFAEFSAPIAGTGTNLELRFNCSSNGSGEELAIDNFRLFEEPSCIPPTFNSNPPNRSVCAGNNTTFSVSVSGATGYQWQVNDGSGFTNISNGGMYANATTSTLVLTGVAANMNGYLFRCVATNQEASCFTTSNSATLTVSNINTSTSYNDVSCFGGSNGSAFVMASGGLPSYSYSWSPSGGTSNIAVGLSAGTYNCTITDMIACSVVRSFTISQPDQLVLSSASQTDPDCYGSATGSASVNPATGGSGTYTYNWTPGNPSGDGTTAVTGLIAGSWTSTVTDGNGCTASVNFTLTQPEEIVNAIEVISCGEYTWGIQTYTSSGEYVQVFPAVSGCDSTVTMSLTINQPTESLLTETACESFSLNGEVYTESGTYYQTLTNAAECDSTITLNLTITQPTESILTETACETYSLNGEVYTGSGTYYQTLLNAEGCDSTITLNLTINQPTESILTETACDTYSLNGEVYTESGTYYQTIPNAAECDSTITLNLTINQPTESILNETACETYSLNGEVYTGSGTYFQTIPNAAGCDSTITLNLTINQPTASILTEMTCETYSLNGEVYTESGTYYQTLPNAAGCDSTITLNLTINSVSDLSIIVIGESIIAANSNATYVWLNCEDFSIIPNEVSQMFTPNSNGNYAVQLTENGCVDTSECVAITTVSIVENSLESNIIVFPNPTSGSLSIDLGAVYENTKVLITDLSGKQIMEKNFTQSQVLYLSIDAPAGMYSVTIQSGNRKSIIQIVKH